MFEEPPGPLRWIGGSFSFTRPILRDSASRFFRMRRVVGRFFGEGAPGDGKSDMVTCLT
jgi:hypothetical protein